MGQRARQSEYILEGPLWLLGASTVAKDTGRYKGPIGAAQWSQR